MKKQSNPGLMSTLATKVKGWGLKERVAAGITAALLTSGGVYYAQAAKTPTDAVKSDMGQHTKVAFNVSSGKDSSWYSRSKYSLLNDTVNYKNKNVTVYVDTKACPNLTYRALRGKTITVSGLMENYKGKSPTIRVTNPSQVTIN
jgi:hypothetical protein